MEEAYTFGKEEEQPPGGAEDEIEKVGAEEGEEVEDASPGGTSPGGPGPKEDDDEHDLSAEEEAEGADLTEPTKLVELWTDLTASIHGMGAESRTPVGPARRLIPVGYLESVATW